MNGRARVFGDNSIDSMKSIFLNLRKKLLRNSKIGDAALKQGTVPVIPYPRNQMKGVKGVHRIDRKFRSHGPQRLRRAYRKRVAVEQVARVIA